MGDLLLQKSFIEDFLTKKSVKNEGQFPQYYVENAHPPIVPKEVFFRVQGKLMQMENEKAVTGKSARLTKKNAIFGIVYCGKCGENYRRYKERGNVKWRCGKRVTERHSCEGRAVPEDEIYDALLAAFRELPEKRDELIRMQERILWGPLDQTSREMDAIDKRKDELEAIISDYAATGHLDRRTVFLYCEDEDPTEEAAIDRISAELDELEKKRNGLLIRKGDLGIEVKFKAGISVKIEK